MGTKNQTGNLAAALFGKARRAVLAMLFSQPEEAFYLRQVARAAGVGQGAVQRELKRLADAGILVRSGRGRQVYYQANPRCPIFEELRGLIVKTAGLAQVIREALLPLAGSIDAAFVYGSLARGEATGDSDVDLLVIGDVDDMALHRAVGKAERGLSREVNYTLLTRAEFRRRRKEKGGFLSRVTEGAKIAIVGNVDEIR